LLRAIELFQGLVLDKNLMFNFRPWDGPSSLDGFRYAFPIAWAIATNHVPVLYAIQETDMSSDTPGSYIIEAADWFTSGYLHTRGDIMVTMIGRLNVYSGDRFPPHSEWRGLMYHHMLSAARQGQVDALGFCFSHTDKTTYKLATGYLMAHLLWEASAHGKKETVGYLWRMVCKSLLTSTS
jgi:hypothetical protein